MRDNMANLTIPCRRAQERRVRSLLQVYYERMTLGKERIRKCLELVGGMMHRWLLHRFTWQLCSTSSKEPG